jgi:hypothetical protein
MFNLDRRYNEQVMGMASSIHSQAVADQAHAPFAVGGAAMMGTVGRMPSCPQLWPAHAVHQPAVHAAGYQPHLHLPPEAPTPLPMVFRTAPPTNTVPSRPASPRIPVVIEIPPEQEPPGTLQVRSSPIQPGNSVQVIAEDADGIDEHGYKRRVFQIAGMDGEPLAIVQMLK